MYFLTMSYIDGSGETQRYQSLFTDMHPISYIGISNEIWPDQRAALIFYEECSRTVTEYCASYAFHTKQFMERQFMVRQHEIAERRKTNPT